MTTDTDAKLIERGRLLFAGEWTFIWASPSIETLPPMAGMEVAFAGRSNVGKSSLINSLTGRNALARTSHTPGRTQELIFFEGPDGSDFRLVDMPGYGYASAPKVKIASWTKLIYNFLQGRASLARVYVLIDSRHGLKDVDLDVLKSLDRSAVSYQIVLTKADQV
jgi:GTP-binding protein